MTKQDNSLKEIRFKIPDETYFELEKISQKNNSNIETLMQDMVNYFIFTDTD